MRFREFEFPMYAEEFRAVDRLRPATERIYRRLRQMVDRATWLVGNRPDNQVSYVGLAESVRWLPPQGSRVAAWKPSERELRSAVDEMARVGLVQRVQLPDMVQRLCLRFVLMREAFVARQDYCAQIDERGMSVSMSAEEWQEERGLESTPDMGLMGGERQEERGMPAGRTREERHISVDVDRDEMDVRASVGEPDDRPGVDASSPTAEGGLSAEQAVRTFRLLLGPDGAPSTGVQRAAVTLAAVVRQRAVTELELQAAIAEARRRGVASVAGYAARMVEQGSLVAAPGGNVVSFGRQRSRGGGVDAVLAAAAEAMGYGG